MPSTEVIAPAMSKRPWRRSVSVSTARPTRKTTRPMGTLTNITQRQEASSVSTPPATSPMAPPAAETVVNSPIARTRWAPSEKTLVRRASEDGAANAAPTPWRARAPSSIHPARANPPRSELSEKMATPRRKVRRRPRRSPERAPEQEQTTEGQEVGVEDPGEPGPREMEAVLDVGQRHVDDRRVQNHHELSGQDDEQKHRLTGHATSGPL